MAHQNRNNNDTNFAQTIWEKFEHTNCKVFEVILPEVTTKITTEHCNHWMQKWEQLDKRNVPKREEIRICITSFGGSKKLFLNDEACALFLSFLLELYNFNAFSSSLSLNLYGSKAHDVRLLEGLKKVPIAELSSSGGLGCNGIGEALQQLFAAQKGHINKLYFSALGKMTAFPHVIRGLQHLSRLELLDQRCAGQVKLGSVLNSLMYSGANKTLHRLVCDFYDCSRSSMELLASKFNQLRWVGEFHDVSLEAIQGLHQSTSIRQIHVSQPQAKIRAWFGDFRRRNTLLRDYHSKLKSHPDMFTNPKLWPIVVRRLELPNRRNNTKEMSVLFAFLQRHLDALGATGGVVPRTIQGGSFCIMPFAEFVMCVEVELKTDGHPLTAQIEVLQDPKKKRARVHEVNSADGMERVVVETPGAGNVVRIVNTGEFPLTVMFGPQVS